MDDQGIPYKVTPMRLADVPDVMAIERRSFPTPWTAKAYRYELKHNTNAYYYVVRARNGSESETIVTSNGWRNKLRNWLRAGSPTRSKILGYVGFWLVAGEAHVSTIAVTPEARRQGLGELLLVTVLGQAMDQGADFLTLEVRVSNHGAQRLYEKYGFERTGRRRAYYSDNREDAWIMTLKTLDSPEFQDLLRCNKRALRGKLSAADGPSSAAHEGRLAK